MNSLLIYSYERDFVSYGFESGRTQLFSSNTITYTIRRSNSAKHMSTVNFLYYMYIVRQVFSLFIYDQILTLFDYLTLTLYFFIISIHVKKIMKLDLRNA